DAGPPRHPCLNATGGSRAVIGEFRSFHVRNGVTVRVIGKNPAIVLVTGDVVIEAGGKVLVRGDGGGGSPNGVGGNGVYNQSAVVNSAGGAAVAGGGAGGTLLWN